MAMLGHITPVALLGGLMVFLVGFRAVAVALAAVVSLEVVPAEVGRVISKNRTP